MNKEIQRIEGNVIKNIEELLPKIYITFKYGSSYYGNFRCIELDYEETEKISVSYVYELSLCGDEDYVCLSTKNVNELLSQGFSDNYYVDEDKAKEVSHKLELQRKKEREDKLLEEEYNTYLELKAKYDLKYDF